MTAAYKLALAAGGLLLLIVIASLILRSDNAPADLNPDAPGQTADASPEATTPGGDAADLPGPPPTRIVYPDTAPAVEVPVDPSPRANASLTVGRSPLDVPDPFAPAPAPAPGSFDAVDVGPPDGLGPEPIGDDDLPPVLTAGAAEPEPEPELVASAGAGIPLRPIDSPGAGPDDPLNPAPPPAPRVLRTHVVAGGETMSSIALDAYGSAARWSDIANANPLVDPNRLRVGQELRLPDLAPATVAAQAPAGDDDAPRRGTTYVVRPGDTLSGIAVQFYNAAAKWELIYQANRDVIGDDPAGLRADTTLRIPPPDRGAQ